MKNHLFKTLLITFFISNFQITYSQKSVNLKFQNNSLLTHKLPLTNFHNKEEIASSTYYQPIKRKNIPPKLLINSKIGNVYYGATIRLGYKNYQIEGIGKTLIRDEFYDDDSYSTKTNPRNNGVFGFSGLLIANNTIYMEFSTELEFPISTDTTDLLKNSNFSYEDINGLNYGLWMNYYYINLGLNPGAVYLLQKETKKYTRPKISYIALSMGIYYSINTSSKNLIYASNDPISNIDSQVEENLKATITGRNIISFVPKLSYRHSSGIGLDLQYRVFGSDALETHGNYYNIIENKNESKFFSIHLLYSIIK